MTSKKNSFWRLCFSLLPGAGEMYMGFLKMGISLMGLFFGILFVSSTLPLGMLMTVDAVVWFYSFFHVHNLASMPDEEFYSIEDDYLFHLSAHFVQGKERITAAVLIFIGALIVWNSIMDILYEYLPEEIYHYIRSFSYDLPRLIVGIAIIALGVSIIRGKKKSLEDFDKD